MAMQQPKDQSDYCLDYVANRLTRPTEPERYHAANAAWRRSVINKQTCGANLHISGRPEARISDSLQPSSPHAKRPSDSGVGDWRKAVAVRRGRNRRRRLLAGRNQLVNVARSRRLASHPVSAGPTPPGPARQSNSSPLLSCTAARYRPTIR